MTSPEVDAESQSTASERREGASTSCQSDKDSVVLPSPSSSASISSVISLDASSEQFSSVEPVADEIREKWTAAENEAMRDKPLHDEDVFEVDLDYASSEDLPSVEQVINSVGCGWWQIYVSFICGLVYMSDAMEMMIMSFLIPAAQKEWGIDSFWKSVLGSVVFSGMLLGAFVFGRIADTYGRKPVWGIVCLFVFANGFASAFAPTFFWMLIFRFGVGVGVGGAHVAFNLFAECLPTQWRGGSLMLFELWWTVGTLTEAGLAWICLVYFDWRTLLAVSSIPVGITMIAFPWVPESARWEVSAVSHRKALKSLRTAAAVNGTTISATDVAASVNEEEDGSVWDLFEPMLRLTTILLWICWFVAGFAYYGIVLMTPDYFARTRQAAQAGMEEVEVPTIAGESGHLNHEDSNDIYFDVFVTTAAELPGVVAAALVINRFGRKNSQTIMMLVCAIATAVLCLGVPTWLMVASACVSRAMVMGSWSVLYVYTPEIYPTLVRSTGLGSSVTMSRLGAIITPFVANMFDSTDQTSGSSPIPLLIYAVTLLCATCASFALPYDTSSTEMGMASTEVVVENDEKEHSFSAENEEDNQEDSPVNDNDTENIEAR